MGSFSPNVKCFPLSLIHRSSIVASIYLAALRSPHTMRVISGSAKGRKLIAVPGEGTRPILDRIKVPLFDMLRPRLAGMTVLDLFAGTGQVGIEALSQGAKHCVFIDLNPKAISTIKHNLETTQLSAQAETRLTDAFSYLRKSSKSFDLIFIAPPQYQSLWVQAVHHIAERPELLNSSGLIVVQIDPKEYEQIAATSFVEIDKRRYGNSMLVVFEKVE